MTWQPIENLPPSWQTLTDPDLPSLANVWREQRQRLENTNAYKTFMGKLRRRIAIETGIIERLYTIERGVTFTLIEYGIDASLIPHGSTDRPAQEVIEIIRDQESAVERVFDVVANQRDLSTSFIKSLHQLLTKNQPTTEAIDQFGRLGEVALLRGDWKRLPNNPTRKDGSLHEYCPPEQVSSQIDQLIVWHLQHLHDGVSPEVEAAWLHHRFTQIHPFQDGNGRVARNLATLVFLKAGWFPLVVLDNDMKDPARNQYIEKLEAADDGDLKPLVDFFAAAQRKTFISILSLSEEVRAEQADRQAALKALGQRISQRQETALATIRQQLETHHEQLRKVAYDRIAQLQRDLAGTLSQVNPTFKLEFATPQAERANYYRYQIIETAKALDYYANLNSYRAWVRLSIQLEGIQTELLVSFHALGRDDQPIGACSACAWQKLPDENGDPTVAQSLSALCPEPFTFGHQEDTQTLLGRFDRWIEGVIVLGIEYLRRRI